MKKLENVMFGVCLALIVFMFVVLQPLSNLDEIWNFNIARGISNGLVPYRDISMVSTPLLGFISAIPLKLFGQEMFYLRILTVVFVLISFILVHKILKSLDIKKEVSNLIMMIMLIIIINFIVINYNLLSLLFILQAVLLEIKALKNEKWNKLVLDIVIGILAGLVVCSKQTIGIVVIAIAIFSPIFYIENKNDVKKHIKKCIARLIGCLLPIVAFIVYLCVNNAFWDFLSYSIKGVSTFSNSVPYNSLLNVKEIQVKVCSVIAPIVIVGALIATIVLKCKKKKNNILYILTAYSIAMFLAVFPISDGEHLVISIIPTLILTVYIVKELLKKYTKKDYKYILQFFNLFPVICILIMALWLEIKNNEELGRISKYQYINHFKYMNVSEELNKSIKEMDNYILSKEKNVYILDGDAAAYMIPIDRYNKNYDMFCLGNLGASGEDGIIEKIKNEDAIYLIKKDESKLNWQNPNKVRAYVKEHMEFIEDIGDYEAYKNKEVIDNISQEVQTEVIPAEEAPVENENQAEPVSTEIQ